MPRPTFDDSVDHYRRILGVLFYVGSIEGLIERTMRGGLIVVPSAPVLVDLPADSTHRAALEKSDLAITDSGFMVLLWHLFTREKINRISGLRYLRALLDDDRFKYGKVLWVMPSKRDEIGNRAWLAEKGIKVEEADCYLAPLYARKGPLADTTLLTLIEERRPQFVMINLGGGVQERLGLFLRDALAARNEITNPEPEVSGTQHSSLYPKSSLRVYRPALICTGAAIAFLSNRQVNIPPWADRLFLGWFMRSLSEPSKFIPRYWHSLQLAALLWKHGSKSVAENAPLKPET